MMSEDKREEVSGRTRIIDIPNVRFNYRTLERTDNDRIVKHYLLIVIENKTNATFYISGFSEYFHKYCRNQAKSTIERKAKIIVPFLNYVLIDNKVLYNVKTIRDLTIEMGNDFLREYAYGRVCGKRKKQKKTIQLAEKTLTQFYYFLYLTTNMKMLRKSDFSFKSFNKSCKDKVYSHESIRNLFLIDYPTVIQPQILHNIQPKLIMEFINFTREVMPDIALAVCLQIFGGLRAGEICNVTYGCIETSSPAINGKEFSWFTIDLRYERQIREDGIYVGGIKKPRIQPIHPVALGLITELYTLHKRIMPRYEFSDAVFLNQNGDPLTYISYNQKFNKLKKLFIEYLASHRDSIMINHATVLATKRWGTHIFRGCFSNIVAHEARTPQEIAYWRGDSDLNSSLTYLQNTERTIERIRNLLYEINDV